MTKVIEDEFEWDAIRGAWDALHALSPTASAALDFVWLRTWWCVYKHSFTACGLRIVTIWRGSRLIGAIPLYVRVDATDVFRLRRLSLLSTGEAEFEETCADYLNFLHLEDDRKACVDAIWRAINQMEWDHLELLDLPEDTALIGSETSPRGAHRFSRGKCPIADLSGGFEVYLQRLSANRRQQSRRLIREGERAGAYFEVVDNDFFGEAFNELTQLHLARWNSEGKRGVFSAKRFVEFHSDILSQWMPTGRAILARLSIDGKAVALLYGFVVGQKKFDFYQSGICSETSGPLRSPGTLAHLLLMRTLIAHGVTEYDFLKGASAYKEHLATYGNELIGVQIWRLNLRTTIYRILQLAKQFLRKGLRIWWRRQGATS